MKLNILLKQQLIHLHEHAARDFTVNIINATFLCLALAPVVGDHFLAIWFSLLFFINLFRLLVSYRDKRQPDNDEALERSLQIYSVGAIVSALVWGSSVVFLFPHESPVHQIFHVLILGAVLTGIIPILAAIKRLFWISLFAILGPLAISLAFHPSDLMHLIICAVMVVYGITLYTSASFLSDTFESLFKSHFQLNALATEDGLTGIPNRRKLDESLKKDWNTAVRNQEFISLLLLDIDYFKQYNDHYGHQAGDECLKSVANILKSMVERATDTVARYGGEEFAVVLPNTPSDGAKVVAERIRKAIENAAITHEYSIVSKKLTVSIGVASFIPQPGQAIESILNVADKALYRSKDNGRNRVSAEVLEPAHRQPLPSAVSITS